MTVLQLEEVGKVYRDYDSEWHRFANWFHLPHKKPVEHWVLKKISFGVDRAEAVGIIGQNGAGKSTLLKLITGTLHPSTGNIVINGRVSAILELGMGFAPELTGRANTFHAGGLLGFTPESIQELLPAIESFAEIGEYFDQPVRTYSSGMQMRLAFSVATALRPDILIVDEALSVGDAYFQHKSFDRIQKFREQGTTLLLVSHDRSAITSICNRVILLENGVVRRMGEPQDVFDYYNALIADKERDTIQTKQLENGFTQTLSGTGEATVEEIGLYDSKGNRVDQIGVGGQVTLRILVKVHSRIDSLVLGYGIRDRLGRVMYGTNTWHTSQIIESAEPGSEYEYEIAFQSMLGIGSYSIQTALVDADTHLERNYEWRDMAMVFSVTNLDKTPFEGCLWNEPVISIRKKNQ